MTSIEGLEEKFKIYLPQIHQKGLEDAFQQAKLLHKQEIKKSYEDGKNLIQYKDEWGEKYYQETFGSKRSDDHISDISKMVSDETPEAPDTYKVDTWTSFHHDKERIINAQVSDKLNGIEKN